MRRKQVVAREKEKKMKRELGQSTNKKKSERERNHSLLDRDRFLSSYFFFVLDQ